MTRRQRVPRRPWPKRPPERLRLHTRPPRGLDAGPSEIAATRGRRQNDRCGRCVAGGIMATAPRDASYFVRGAKESVMANRSGSSRRAFVHAAALTGTTLWVAGCAGAGAARPRGTKAADATVGGAEEVAPPEDLMREHGVLKRVMLVYEEIVRRVDARQDFPPDALADAANVIRSFVEDYHEKLEEDYLFPRFEKANTLVDLCEVLRVQHQKGRVLTDQTMHLATAAAIKDAGQRTTLRNSLYQFVRMYEPHEARE